MNSPDTRLPDASGPPPPARPQIIIPKLDLIPAVLTALPQWVLWKHELRKDGKWAKVPYQVDGRRAKTDDPSIWNTFDAVRCAYQQGGWSGIGLCRAGNQVFAELDGCFTSTGGWAQWGWDGPQPKQIYDRFAARCYT